MAELWRLRLYCDETAAMDEPLSVLLLEKHRDGPDRGKNCDYVMLNIM